jgi:hypothetical protein
MAQLTPRKKAVKLQRIMYENGSKDSCEVYREATAKRCAIVCVEEIMEYGCLPPVPISENIEYSEEFWLKVKAELEKL